MKFLLNIPGGGVRGAFSARIIDRLVTNGMLDLGGVFSFAGTSTGSIVAAGLACGLSPRRIVKLYQDLAKDVFTTRWHLPRWLWSIWDGAPYDITGLEDLLNRAFEGRKLEDVEKKLVFVTWNVSGRVDGKFKASPLIIHNHPTKEILPALKKVSLAKLISSSCAAPTYFAPQEFKVGGEFYRLCDGGLVSNMATLSHYLIIRSPYYAPRRIEREEVRSLTIGNCASHPFEPPAPTGGWKGPQAFGRVVDSIVAANASYSHLAMKTFLDGAHFFFDPEPPPGSAWAMDDAAKIPEILRYADRADLSPICQWIGQGS